MASRSLDHLAKACAFVVFADERIEASEIEAVKGIFAKYGFDSAEGEAAAMRYLDGFIGKSGEKGADETIRLGKLAITGADTFEILKDLAGIAVSDGEMSMGEVEVIHLLAEAFGLHPVLASLALLHAASKTPDLKFSLEENHG